MVSFISCFAICSVSNPFLWISRSLSLAMLLESLCNFLYSFFIFSSLQTILLPLREYFLTFASHKQIIVTLFFIRHLYTFLADSRVNSQPKKVSIMFLSKEATNKDQSLKMQMMLSVKDGKTDSAATEKIWKSSGFFGNQRTDLTIAKANFPDNTLVYLNNGSISAAKGGQTAIYLDYVILVQILPVINSPDSLDNYQDEDNEVLLYVPLYNKQNGLYRGLKKISRLHKFERG